MWRRSWKCESLRTRIGALTIAHLSLQLRWAKNINLVEDVEILLSVKFLWIPFSSYKLKEKSKMSQQLRGQGGHLVFWSAKNKHLVEILLHVKFRWIPFSGFREVENVSANQRTGQPSCFPISPKNTNFAEDVEILLPVKFPLISFWEVENVSANQRPSRPPCFSGRPKIHKLSRGPWNLTSCQVSLNSIQRL